MLIVHMARHVGNKIAVFVLQSMGCDASVLNTVQFSTSALRS